MQRRPLIIGLLILASVLAILLWPLEKQPDRIRFNTDAINAKQEFLATLKPDTDRVPNVVIILADDLGRSDISLFGNTLISTPNIDSIGLLGATFTEGYITSPICSPSRAGLLTGRYQQRFGFEYILHDRYARNRLEWLVYKYLLATDTWQVLGRPVVPTFQDVAAQGLPPEQITLAEVLKAKGYATAAIGKWHLGSAPHALPNARGFDLHYGFYEGYSLYMADSANAGIVNQRHARNTDFSDPFIWGAGRQGNCAIRLNGEVVDERVYLTDRIAEEAVKFISANSDRPFFLYVPFLTPHTPFQATKVYYDRLSHIEDRNKRVYLAMIAQMDDAVGTIMAQLRASGISDNTMIFFLSDNGGATYTLATDNAPFRGGKFTHFEGGLRVPFMMRWDGVVEAGSKVSLPTSSLDIMATVLDTLGVEMPVANALDGCSLLKDEGQQTRNLYWRSGYAWAIRSGRWKLVAEDDWGLGFGPRVRLFDMHVDSLEQNDLSALRPEVVDSLRTMHRKWQQELQEPLWPNVMNFRFQRGSDDSWFPL
jgi:arylsulfatase A-like enzyme